MSYAVEITPYEGYVYKVQGLFSGSGCWRRVYRSKVHILPVPGFSTPILYVLEDSRVLEGSSCSGNVVKGAYVYGWSASGVHRGKKVGTSVIRARSVVDTLVKRRIDDLLMKEHAGDITHVVFFPVWSPPFVRNGGVFIGSDDTVDGRQK